MDSLSSVYIVAGTSPREVLENNIIQTFLPFFFLATGFSFLHSLERKKQTQFLLVPPLLITVTDLGLVLSSLLICIVSP